MTKQNTLVVDLDGTLIRTDTFHEMLIRLMKRMPWLLPLVPFWLWKGRAQAKARLYDLVGLDPKSLPYNEEFLEYLKKEHQQGRELILATGSDQRIAQSIADYVGIFHHVLATNGTINMTGHHKREHLEKMTTSYDYAGDSRIDARVWRGAQWALVVHPKWKVLDHAHASAPRGVARIFPRVVSRMKAFITMLYPQGWVGALAIFLPLLWQGIAFENACWLFFSLCAISSSARIMVELISLENMRFIGKKGMLCAGHLHLVTGFIAVPLLFTLAMVFALLVSPVLHPWLTLGWLILILFDLFVCFEWPIARVVVLASVAFLLI